VFATFRFKVPPPDFVSDPLTPVMPLVLMVDVAPPSIFMVKALAPISIPPLNVLPVFPSA
jgi:hypothetical protein